MNKKKQPREVPLSVDELLGIPTLEDVMAGMRKDTQKGEGSADAQGTEERTSPASSPGEKIRETRSQDTIRVSEAPAEDKDGDLAWNIFLENSRLYGKDWRYLNTVNFRIETDIVRTLQCLDIKRLSATKLANCMLRSFIEEHARELKKYRKKERNLLTNTNNKDYGNY
jgi:hypothetical protein